MAKSLGFCARIVRLTTRERDDDDELELREEEGSRSIIRAKLGSSLGPWKRRMKPTGTPHASRRRCFTSIAEHHARTRSR